MLFWTSLTAFLAALLTNFGYRSLREFSRHELEEICHRRERGERLGQILRLHEQVAIGVETLAALFTSLALVAGTAWAAERWQIAPGESWIRLLSVAGGLGLLLVLARTWGPWPLSRVFAEKFLFNTWPLWRALAALASPLTLVARVCDTVLHRLVGQEPQVIDEQAIEEEIRTIVSEGHREGLLEDDARGMIEGVIELGEDDVSQIMTPRTDMHMVSIQLSWDDIIADVIEAGHTRVPVYGENRDDIVGMLYSKDLIPELAKGDAEARQPLADILRKPLFVPETKRVDDLLEMFQQLRTHIAVVLDEYGGVSGLVTIEDVLEEIVGEIVDEYDPEQIEEISRIDVDVCEALGRAHVDEINVVMGLELPEDGDFDTIGGFVFTELGRIPQQGESIVWQERVRISVLEASKRRIDRVKIERLTTGQLEIA
ncbi:hemolysin family protein [Adhaeretor mobilis]|uniref:hemolysin family protein n=1 Tax=Adhaeretor mobilis TaxID=1930276 RepID=UPI0011A4BF1C|nr:hemolysin family protein [Adhaeretor mobilis]